MKKYAFIAFIAISSLVTSCTTDNDVLPTSKVTLDDSSIDYSLMQKEGDSIPEGETGGETGNNPIKP